MLIVYEWHSQTLSIDLYSAQAGFMFLTEWGPASLTERIGGIEYLVVISPMMLKGHY